MGWQDGTSNLCGFCAETTMIGQILVIIIKLKLRKGTLVSSLISSTSWKVWVQGRFLNSAVFEVIQGSAYPSEIKRQ